MKMRQATRAKRSRSGAQAVFKRLSIGAVALGALAVGATAIGALITISKGQTVLTTVPQQDRGDLDESQIVEGLFLVTHQNRPALGKPAQRPFHYPSPRRITLLPSAIFLLLADAPSLCEGRSHGTPPPPRPPPPCRSPCPGTGAGAIPPKIVDALPRWRRAWLPAT